MRIRDVYPGYRNRDFPSRDLGSTTFRIRIKSLSIFNPKICFKTVGKMIWNVHSGFWIRIFSHPDPGSKKAADPGLQQWVKWRCTGKNDTISVLNPDALDLDPGWCWNRIRVQAKIFYDKILKNLQSNIFLINSLLFKLLQRTCRFFKFTWMSLACQSSQLNQDPIRIRIQNTGYKSTLYLQILPRWGTFFHVKLY